MSTNDPQFGQNEPQRDVSESHPIHMAHSLGVPFPEFEIPSEYLSESGEVMMLGDSSIPSSSIPPCGGPGDTVGGPWRALVIVQSKKRASFF